MFPCYYLTRGDVLVLGSSSYVPVLHPAMPRRLNFKALLGHLLFMVEILGAPLWQQCRRLGVGEILHFNRQGLRTLREQSIPVSDAYFGLPYEAQLDRAHAAMAEACEQYRDKPVSVLFSGGLDSRLLAGYLGTVHARVEAAYTFGLPSDIEFRCARRVCRELGWRQVLLPVDYATYPSLADHLTATEHLANGLSNLPAWPLQNGLLNGELPLVNGFQGDPILGGSNIPWAYDRDARRYSFDRLFQQHNARGICPELLCRLFPGGETPRLIAEIVAELRNLYESLPGHDFQKVWQFTLLHRLRYHIAGILGRIARDVWPSAPYTHDAVLAAGGGMPAASLWGRRLQRDLLVGRFPRLAALPLDSNSPNPRPLAPSFAYRLRHRIRRTLGLHRLPWPGGERRFFYRLYDINNPGWRRVREEGFRLAAGLSGVLNIDCLRELLPEARVRIEVEDAIIDASGRKSLLAFILWYNRYADTLLRSERPSLSVRDAVTLPQVRPPIRRGDGCLAGPGAPGVRDRSA